MSHTKKDLVNFRIQRAYDTLQTARTVTSSGDDWNTVANRLYYASFYAVLALLAEHELDTYTHKGVKTMLSQHFIKSGLLDAGWGKLYQKLFDSRTEADYEDFAIFTADDVLPLLPQTEAFIDVIKHLIDKP